MARRAFHVCRFVSTLREAHGAHSYREHADAFAWALEALGYEATVGENLMRRGVTNILMGSHMLDEAGLRAVPSDSIIYNLEQMRRVPMEQFVATFRLLPQRFPIWDFSESNLPVWQALGDADPQHVKIGWAACLERIPRAPEQDIEVLMYGMPGPERIALYQRLCQAGLHAVFVCGLYGEQRDALIARSKIVVNAGFLPAKIHEISRISYLLCNSKAVVSQLDPESFIEPDMREAIHFSSPETIVADCLALVEDDARRRALEARGYAAIRRRDMRDILRAALATLPARA